MRAALCRARVASSPRRRRVVASRAAMDVTFVTSNARKLAEARAILGATPALTLTSRALDLPELQGEPEDVARAKARRAAASSTVRRSSRTRRCATTPSAGSRGCT